MPAPTMTPEQRAAALEKARVVRAKRSEITNKLAMGLTTPAEVLDQIDDPIIGRTRAQSDSRCNRKGFRERPARLRQGEDREAHGGAGHSGRASSAGPRLQPDGRPEGRPFLSLNRGNLASARPEDGRFLHIQGP